MRHLLLLGAAVLSLSACANAQPYGGVDAVRRGPGLYETSITADRVRIVHQGPPGLGAAQVEDVALLRAAERTVQNGYEWFIVDNRYSEVSGGVRGNGPFVSIGGGSTNFGRSSAVGLGGSIGFNLGSLGGMNQPSLTSTLEVRMGRGPKPEGAYDAADLQRTLATRASPYPW